ncbi:hypothetical protein HHI36_009840 [Cryptolaemus montrouzieri]|uniref:Protein kinase domain-containing protein n=1 Tax=Cryptolaemus montrouzieri TaxID=559131 RepID=A0ABD2MH29_9CUCU
MGNIDFEIGSEKLQRSYSATSYKSYVPMKYAADFALRSTSNKSVSCGNDNRQDKFTSTIEQDSTTVNMSPRIEQGEEGVLLSTSSTIQPEWRINYSGDYKGTVRPISTKDLLAWAFQVARGMEYLASRKVLHGDLAARNILLADDNIVKICDFGLAKSMYNNENYKKKSDGPLPIKWMAIESIRDRVFSTQSDVWSFGIVLWEFFSLARTPYPGMEADERLYSKLVEGYRMESPEFATTDIYQMMLECWSKRPQNRPSFTQLTEKLGTMLEESVKMHYIDLNDPYLMMNEKRFLEPGSDYLTMVSTPNFENLSSPQQYINDLQNCQGYMSMNSLDIFSPKCVEQRVFTFENRETQGACRSGLKFKARSPVLRLMKMCL